MTLTTVRLVDDTGEMLLRPRPGLALRTLEAPMPEVREVTEDRNDADGVDDTTTRHGSRAVTIELRAYDNPPGVVDELARFMHPSKRPWLVVGDDWWGGERRLRLRSSQFTAPRGRATHVNREIQAQWVAPDGVWEAAEPFEVTIPANTGQLAGRTYPLVFPRSYPATSPAGIWTEDNPGSTFSDFTARLYGPCDGPRLFLDETGEGLIFQESLSLSAGEYVEVDSRRHTALLMSMTDASRLSFLDFANSTWWRLRAGQNTIRYAPVSGVNLGAAAVVEYRPSWL